MEKIRLAVICDFDGTITRIDVGHQVYTRFGDERWEEINKRWRRGEISSKDCLIGEYSLMDASEAEVREHVLKMEIDAGFIDLVATCRNNDIPIAVASDGFDFYIYTVLEKYGLYDMEVLCNKLKFNGRKVELSFPFYDRGCGVCGNCKKLHVQRFRDDSRTVIYVGDGLSDRFAARASDVAFAKGELMGYLMDNNVEFVRFTDLRDVNKWMTGFLAGDIDLPAWAGPKPDGSADPCEEAASLFKKNDEKPEKSKPKEKSVMKKLKMKKRVEDMGDGRYVVYYEWA